MNKELKIFSYLHKRTKRNYIERMLNKKAKNISIAKKYSKQYWDGPRSVGYGGYKYIKNYWKPVAEKLIKNYRLNNKSKILDIGCGKGFLLYEIKKIIPNIDISGFDISYYAIKNSPKEIKKFLTVHNAKKKFPYKSKEFDLAFSFGCVHNLKIFDLEKCLKEFTRVSKKQFLMTESYKNDKQLFNLQCWALTCESFFSYEEWKWIFKKFDYKGDYEFIYFE